MHGPALPARTRWREGDRRGRVVCNPPIEPSQLASASWPDHHLPKPTYLDSKTAHEPNRPARRGLSHTRADLSAIAELACIAVLSHVGPD
jgi:hypothetical protein